MLISDLRIYEGRDARLCAFGLILPHVRGVEVSAIGSPRGFVGSARGTAR